MQPADIARLVSPGDPRVSPDGARVAFVVSRVDLEADRYRTAIWLAPVDGRPRPLTAGDGDADPRWSPDGTRLAFTRSTPGPGARHRLVVLPVDGPGEMIDVAVDFSDSVSRLVDMSVACRYLAAQCQVRQGKWTDATEMLGEANPFRGSGRSGPAIPNMDGGIKVCLCIMNLPQRGLLKLRLEHPCVTYVVS